MSEALRFASFFAVEVQAFTVHGHEGGDVIITCGYNVTYRSNRKYLCKGSGGVCSKNIIVDSGGTPAQDKRFILQDNPMEGNLTVLFTELNTEDSGLYKCVVDQAPPVTSTDIQLKVNTG